MENSKIIYAILKTIDDGMDTGKVDEEAISAEGLGISEPRRINILLALESKGLIEGLMKVNTLNCKDIRCQKARLTADGMQYLEENSMMKKAYRILASIRNLL